MDNVYARMARGESVSWGEIAAEDPAHCASSPDGTGAHVPGDDDRCEECGAEAVMRARGPVTVHYHAEPGEPARPAINVKCHVAGPVLWPKGWEDHPGGWALTGGPDQVRRASAFIDAAWDSVASDFWQAAEEQADRRGLGPIHQAGRSGGWLVFELDPVALCECRPRASSHQPTDAECPLNNWLDGYAAMREWAEAYIAAAPARVRDLAQGMAMDEIGSRAVALASIRAALR
jgi:hypothetical protein